MKIAKRKPKVFSPSGLEMKTEETVEVKSPSDLFPRIVKIDSRELMTAEDVDEELALEEMVKKHVWR
jgi:hypothetical protein